MKPEQKFYQWFKNQLPTTADCCRVETSTMGGMPDVNVCEFGVEIWVELKVFMAGRVLIRKEQNSWFHRRLQAGGKVFIIAQHPSGIHVWNDKFEVTPHGKYLQVTSAPNKFFVDGKQLVNFLFTTEN